MVSLYPGSNALVDHHDENGQFVDLVFKNDPLRNTLGSLMLDLVYGRLQPAENVTIDGVGSGK